MPNNNLTSTRARANKGPLLVEFAGPQGAGKTTIADKIARIAMSAQPGLVAHKRYSHHWKHRMGNWTQVPHIALFALKRPRLIRAIYRSTTSARHLLKNYSELVFRVYTTRQALIRARKKGIRILYHCESCAANTIILYSQGRLRETREILMMMDKEVYSTVNTLFVYKDDAVDKIVARRLNRNAPWDRMNKSTIEVHTKLYKSIAPKALAKVTNAQLMKIRTDNPENAYRSIRRCEDAIIEEGIFKPIRKASSRGS